jgi:hypothetical protein
VAGEREKGVMSGVRGKSRSLPRRGAAGAVISTVVAAVVGLGSPAFAEIINVDCSTQNLQNKINAPRGPPC